METGTELCDGIKDLFSWVIPKARVLMDLLNFSQTH